MSIGELLRLFAPQGQPYVSPGQRPGMEIWKNGSPERANEIDASHRNPGQRDVENKAPTVRIIVAQGNALGWECRKTQALKERPDSPVTRMVLGDETFIQTSAEAVLF